MLIQEKILQYGYTEIVSPAQVNLNMLHEFGLLFMHEGMVFNNQEHLERVFMLVKGKIQVTITDGMGSSSFELQRDSLIHEKPAVIHVSGKTQVSLESHSRNTELTIHKVANPKHFPAKVITPSEIREQTLFSDALKDTTERIIRTAVDDENSPCSNITLGELINKPGRWSSYPPHHHPHPEVYHYRFIPEHGFGYGEAGGKVFRIKNGDTLLIPPGTVHPQVSAPGFTMLYIWSMPHLPDERFGPHSRRYEDNFQDMV